MKLGNYWHNTPPVQTMLGPACEKIYYTAWYNMTGEIWGVNNADIKRTGVSLGIAIKVGS